MLTHSKEKIWETRDLFLCSTVFFVCSVLCGQKLYHIIFFLVSLELDPVTFYYPLSRAFKHKSKCDFGILFVFEVIIAQQPFLLSKYPRWITGAVWIKHWRISINQLLSFCYPSIYWLSGFYMFTVCRWNDELMSQDTRNNFKIQSGQISSSVWCHRLCDIITAMSLWIDWYTCTINWRIDYQFALQALNTNWFFIDHHIKFGWQSTNESHRLYWLFLKAGEYIRPGTDWLVSLG